MGMINGLKKFFNFSPAKWAGVDHIKTQTHGIKSLINAFFVPQKPMYEESFEEALERLGLTEADLQQRQKEFQFLMRFFLGIAGVLVLYAVYLIFKHAWWPVAGTGGVLLIVLSQVFRYHFWLFQIKRRKLGCSIWEWLAGMRGTR